MFLNHCVDPQRWLMTYVHTVYYQDLKFGWMCGSYWKTCTSYS